jgi:hypothetical protein
MWNRKKREIERLSAELLAEKNRHASTRGDLLKAQQQRDAFQRDRNTLMKDRPIMEIAAAAALSALEGGKLQGTGAGNDAPCPRCGGTMFRMPGQGVGDIEMPARCFSCGYVNRPPITKTWRQAMIEKGHVPPNATEAEKALVADALRSMAGDAELHVSDEVMLDEIERDAPPVIPSKVGETFELSPAEQLQRIIDQANEETSINGD